MAHMGNTCRASCLQDTTAFLGPMASMSTNLWRICRQAGQELVVAIQLRDSFGNPTATTGKLRTGQCVQVHLCCFKTT